MAKLNIITLGSSKSYTDLAALGLTNVVVNDQDKTISFTLVADGSTRTLHFAQPSDGVSVTGISDKGNGKFTLLFSDGSESDPIQTIKGQKGDKGDKLTFNDLTDAEKESLKGSNGVSPTITENADNTDKIYKLDITTADTTFTTPNLKGADGQGGSGGSGEANVIDSISVNGVNVEPDENKNVDITVPSIDGLAKTEDIPTKVSELTNDSGYLTEHQDISGKVDKVNGKSLIADTEIERLASVDNYDDTQVKTQIQTVANGLMDSVGYSADYKTIDIIAKNGVKKSVNVAPIISHASITELSDVDTTNKATGKALVYNAITSKHEYAAVSGTDEKVKMDASTDAKYLGELLDNVTIANENGELKVKKLDGQEVTITEINYLKGLTMNVMDLVNMFSNGGVKIINTPVATYAELLTIDKSSFIEGISYLVYVLADENHDNAKTTYLVDKDSETPTYFGFADSQRDFTTNPIDLATEITGKLGISNMDSDAIKALFTVDDTYKTETTTNNAFSTHGAKALYDELLLAIGGKANDSDLTNHKDDANIHVSTEDRTKWDSAKTHADSAHAPSNAQANVLETVKVNGTALEVSNKAVNVTVPTTVAQLTDSSSYAKTADIPTTLPANGGNSDTVNNHTVKSDVPTDAVFTDTVYDDTEVKGSIEELSSNLNDLVYGDNGGYNIFKDTTWVVGRHMAENGINDYPETGSAYSDYISIVEPNTYYISSFTHPKSTVFEYDANKSFIKYNGWKKDNNIPCVLSGNCAYIRISFNGASSNIQPSNVMLAKTPNLPYEPYIPSVKMLTDEVNAQNESLDTLEFGEVAGGKNLFDVLSKFSKDDNSYIYNLKLKPNTSYTCSSNIPVSDTASIWFGGGGSAQNGVFIGKPKTFNTDSNGNIVVYIRYRTDVDNTVDAYNGIINGTYWCQIEEGTQATDYEPYIPSVKMLADKTIQIDDLNVLGWVVPEECPVQNYVDGNGVFHQRVGRIDLSTLEKIVGADVENGEFIFLNPTNCAVNNNQYSSIYNCVNWSEWESSADKVLHIDRNGNCYIKNKSYNNFDNFISAMKGHYLYYELAEEILIKVDGNEAISKVNDSLSVIGKCKNLLNPTLQTTTLNGVTCTNNGDGTYTLNGTATSEVALYLIDNDNIQIPKGMYKTICSTDDNIKSAYYFSNKGWISDNQFEITQSDILGGMWIKVQQDYTCDNVIIKPMITTNLNATYDDFVPYTGDGDTLTHDVAELKNDLAPKKIELQNVDERVTIQDNGSFIINGFAFVNLLVTFNETLPQWSNFVRLPRPKGGNVSVHCENSVKLTIYSQDNLPGDCGTYDIVQSGTEVRLLVNYEIE